MIYYNSNELFVKIVYKFLLGSIIFWLIVWVII